MKTKSLFLIVLMVVSASFNMLLSLYFPEKLAGSARVVFGGIFLLSCGIVAMGVFQIFLLVRSGPDSNPADKKSSGDKDRPGLEHRIKIHEGCSPRKMLRPRDPYQVLAVDDDPACLDLVNSFLKRDNISCETVSSGEAAMEVIESGKIPCLVLLDISMGGLSGYTVCQRLRETFPASELPIIMLTGRQSMDDLVKAYGVGANDYISKPFSREELVARVRCNLDLQKSYEIVKENLRLEMEVQLQKQKNVTANLATEQEAFEKLRYQINPHFLFNALASIRGAVFSNREAAHKMVSHLSEFCRLSLSHGCEETLSIAREISIITHYLSMEQMRFGDYMTITVDIQPEVESMIIPAFILQPLVENAIKYGTRTSPDFLEITILVRVQPPDNILIRISNTGDWIPRQANDSRVSPGIGIQNINARLDRFYSGRQDLQKEILDGQVSMTLILPDILS